MKETASSGAEMHYPNLSLDFIFFAFSSYHSSVEASRAF